MRVLQEFEGGDINVDGHNERGGEAFVEATDVVVSKPPLGVYSGGATINIFHSPWLSFPPLCKAGCAHLGGRFLICSNR